MNIATIGVFNVGMLVGFILGYILIFSTSLAFRIVASVISSALGGALVVVMSNLTFEKWMYPLGLAVGLVWTRIFSARLRRRYPSRRVRFCAWLDIIAVGGATLVMGLTPALRQSPQMKTPDPRDAALEIRN